MWLNKTSTNKRHSTQSKTFPKRVEVRESMSLSRRLREILIRINCRAFPPSLIRPEQKDSEMEMRRIWRSIAGRAYKSDHFTALHAHSFGQAVCVTFQVSIVITIRARLVELVNRIPARLAEEEFLYHA